MEKWQAILIAILELDSAQRKKLLDEYTKVERERGSVEFASYAGGLRKTASVSMGPKITPCPFCGK